MREKYKINFLLGVDTVFFSLHLTLERWKWNDEYKVWVSTLGNVRGKDKKDKKILLTKNGYCAVKIGTKLVLVHRLTMKTWRPCENMGQLTIDHLDHNKRNNRLSNLEWVTRGENERRAAEDYYDIQDNIAIKKTRLSKIETQIPKQDCIKIDNILYSPKKAAEKICATNPKGLSEYRALKKISMTINDGISRSYGGVRFEAVIV